MTFYISVPIRRDDSRDQVAFYREVEPYLDRVFPGWELLRIEGGETITHPAHLILQTPSLLVRMVRFHDGDTLYFAPDASYHARQCELNVPYLQWLLRERPLPQGIADQLDWLERHPTWRKRWEDRRVHDEYELQSRRSYPLKHEFMNSFQVGPGNALTEVQLPSPPAVASSEDLAASSLFQRASGYFSMILGPAWKAHLHQGALYVTGDHFDIKIHVEGEEEVLSVTPSGSNLRESSGHRSEWLDVRRVTQTFVRETLDHTVESKLGYLAAHVGDYMRICRPESFQDALSLITQDEAINAELIRILTGE